MGKLWFPTSSRTYWWAQSSTARGSGKPGPWHVVDVESPSKTPGGQWLALCTVMTTRAGHLRPVGEEAEGSFCAKCKKAATQLIGAPAARGNPAGEDGGAPAPA